MVVKLNKVTPLDIAISRFMKDQPITENQKAALETIFKEVHEALVTLKPHASPSESDMLGITENLMSAWLIALKTGASHASR